MTAPYVRSSTSIGGSDVAIILGLSKYKTQAQLYDEIVAVHNVPVTDGKQRYVGDNHHIARGRKAEDWIADLYAEQTGFQVQRVERFYSTTMPFHFSVDRGILIPNLEALGIGPGEKQGMGLMEVKAHSSWVLKDVLKNGVPPYYYCQMQWYYLGTGWEWGEYVTLDYDNWEVIRIPVPPNPEYILDMTDKVVAWWERHIKAGVRPPDTFIDDDEREWPMPRIDEPVVRTDEEVERAFRTLQMARENFSMMERQKKMAEEKVKELMGDIAVMEVPGLGKVSWKESTSSHFDKEALMGHGAIDPIKLMEFLTNWSDDGRVPTALQDRIRIECALDLNQFTQRKATRRFLPKFEA